MRIMSRYDTSEFADQKHFAALYVRVVFSEDAHKWVF